MYTVMQLSRELLTRRAGDFDSESIFTLNLRKIGVRLSRVLNECTNVKSLDLSLNGLRSLKLPDGKRLNPMSQLKYLNLSHNLLTNLDSLPVLKRLETLHLEGNLIQDVKALEPLKEACPRLKHLYLQTVHEGQPNPVCKEKEYVSIVSGMFPLLCSLDGMRIKFKYSLFRLQEKILEHEQKRKTEFEVLRGERKEEEKKSALGPVKLVSKEAMENLDMEIMDLKGEIEICKAILR
ncbi:hypothetical protein AAMO2058_000253200 [Amorphochlora amoebiformis]